MREGVNRQKFSVCLPLTHLMFRASIENLKALEQFLSKEAVKEKWYQPEDRLPAPHDEQKKTV